MAAARAASTVVTPRAGAIGTPWLARRAAAAGSGRRVPPGRTSRAWATTSWAAGRSIVARVRHLARRTAPPDPRSGRPGRARPLRLGEPERGHPASPAPAARRRGRGRRRGPACRSRRPAIVTAVASVVDHARDGRRDRHHRVDVVVGQHRVEHLAVELGPGAVGQVDGTADGRLRRGEGGDGGARGLGERGPFQAGGAAGASRARMAGL